MNSQSNRFSKIDAQETRLLRCLGKRIVEQAAKSGKSIERLAYEAGVSKGYLYDIVKGKGNPSLVILSRIAAGLDVSLKELFC